MPRSKTAAKTPQEKRKRCGKCGPCQRKDCGQCSECVNKKKFGGDGSSRQSCVFRRCEALFGRSSVAAAVPQQQSQPLGAKRGPKAPPSSIINPPVPSSASSRKRSKTSSEHPSKRQKRTFPATSSFESNFMKDETERSSTKKMKTNIVNPKFMGKPLPSPPIGSCAKCKRDDKDEAVLLCDGKGCSMEYHLSCAGLKEIPEGDWFCSDCHPTGTGYEALMNYLEGVDEKRTDYESSHDFCNALHRHLPQNTGQSELQELKASGTTKKGNEPSLRNNSKGVSEQDERWIGKPIWMRLPDHDGPPSSTTLVSGRICDVRRHLIGNKERSNELEYLVRFAAGHQGRKKTYHHWIYLEEHQLMVGDRMVWAGKGDKVAPAMVYFRTRRELALKNPPTNPRLSPAPKGVTGVSSASLEKPGLVNVGYFGIGIQDRFEVLDPKEDVVVDFLDPSYQEKLSSTHANEVAATKAESQEQQAVQAWYSLPESSVSKNPWGSPFHSLSLSKRDYFSLPPLKLKNHEPDTLQHADLCPLVPGPGSIDRNHVLQILRGKLRPSKEVGAILSIQEVSYRWDQNQDD